MLGFERGKEPKPLADPTTELPTDRTAEAWIQADLRRQLDGPTLPWPVPDLVDAPIEPSVDSPLDAPAPLPWRSATVASLAQVPATVEAAFLDVSLTLLTVQVVVVAAMGLCLVLAEWMSINRVGVADEQPQPNLRRPHPHRSPHR